MNKKQWATAVVCGLLVGLIGGWVFFHIATYTQEVRMNPTLTLGEYFSESGHN